MGRAREGAHPHGKLDLRLPLAAAPPPLIRPPRGSSRDFTHFLPFHHQEHRGTPTQGHHEHHPSDVESQWIQCRARDRVKRAKGHTSQLSVFCTLTKLGTAEDD
jgi:hypothetical protein